VHEPSAESLAAGAEGEHRGHARRRRLVIIALVVLVLGAAATSFGWDIGSWIKEISHTLKSVPAGYLVGAIACLTVQTTATAWAWFSVLRYAYPRSRVLWREVYAVYATAVALNFVLPANLGTVVMLVMFNSMIAAASFAGVTGGFAIHKVFYTAIGSAVYLYLFLTVGGSFDLQFGFVSEQPVAFAILVAGGATLIFLVARAMRSRLARWWEQAKEGGRIITDPRTYVWGVLLPEAISWVAMLGVIALFLAAYSIPITFHTLMSIVGGNSLANMTAATPGSAGLVQGFNALSLKGIVPASTATAYSVSQQLVSTVWAILLAIALMVHAFGLREGKEMVSRSYAEARERAAEETPARKARRQARRRGGAPSA
jgi:hypothetical protein